MIHYTIGRPEKKYQLDRGSGNRYYCERPQQMRINTLEHAFFTRTFFKLSFDAARCDAFAFQADEHGGFIFGNS